MSSVRECGPRGVTLYTAAHRTYPVFRIILDRNLKPFHFFTEDISVLSSNTCGFLFFSLSKTVSFSVEKGLVFVVLAIHPKRSRLFG